jgi:hypothetical protein
MRQSDPCPACADDGRGGTFDLTCPDCLAEWAALSPAPRYAFRWYGGGSYGHAPATEVEPAQSLREVRETVECRFHGCDSYRPAVDENSGAWIYRAGDLESLASYLKSGDTYPDFVTEFGPRGGVRVTPA